MSQFSGKTFSGVVSTPLESACETNWGKFVWVFTQGLQLWNINRCHRVFYSFWCLKSTGKLLFLRGNSCQLCCSAKKQGGGHNWKKKLRISELPRAICDFATWGKQVRFPRSRGRSKEERFFGIQSLVGENWAFFLLGWVNCASCSIGYMQFLIFRTFPAFEGLLRGLDRDSCSQSVHWARAACNIYQ